ncbi:MAG TPA: hypothetical protein VL854_07140 [Nitrososphaeraceae archaeon]|nr:hypothetical protein [Nitrososphaeraceae archaeon]
MTKKILVTFPDGVWHAIEKDVMPQLGYGDSEVVRGMVMAYLNEKGYLLRSKVRASNQELVKELDAQGLMVEALVELLSKNGHIMLDEWRNMVNKKIE